MNDYKKSILEHYGLKCQRCNKSFPAEELVIQNKNGSEIENHNIENFIVLCKSCHSKLLDLFEKLSTDYIGLKGIEQGIYLIFKELQKKYGLALDDVNLQETPQRIARAYAEIFSGVKNTQQQVKDVLSKSFPTKNDNMVIMKNIRVYSMCPHHFLPVIYDISIGYIPHKKVLGVSKLSRLCEILAKRPVLQEDITLDIANSLMKIKPVGVMVITKGRHLCMEMRGTKQINSSVTCSAIRGCFEKQEIREEFLSLVGVGS